MPAAFDDRTEASASVITDRIAEGPRTKRNIAVDSAQDRGHACNSAPRRQRACQTERVKVVAVVTRVTLEDASL